MGPAAPTAPPPAPRSSSRCAAVAPDAGARDREGGSFLRPTRPRLGHSGCAGCNLIHLSELSLLRRLQFRRYQLKLGYDTVPTFLGLLEKVRSFIWLRTGGFKAVACSAGHGGSQAFLWLSFCLGLTRVHVLLGTGPNLTPPKHRTRAPASMPASPPPCAALRGSVRASRPSWARPERTRPPPLRRCCTPRWARSTRSSRFGATEVSGGEAANKARLSARRLANVHMLESIREMSARKSRE